MAFGQELNTVESDTVTLPEVIVTAYRYDRPASEVPAAISISQERDFLRFSNTSILPTMNMVPGVRMEERSPGSYRFSIRGSLLRSPFGVRNVKMYWNGLPLTDGGGNTYLNLLDFSAISSAEIIKGPGSSLYGAGTGGVVLLNNKLSSQPYLSLSTLVGSYGLQRYQLSTRIGSGAVSAAVQFAHQQADGYRRQAAMRRDAINADVKVRMGNGASFSSTVFYTDLFYETPGGLTKAQYDEDPQQARPPRTAPPPQPGAEDADAAVRNKTGYVGLLYDYSWGTAWSANIGVYASQTDFQNPSIRNYEKRAETNVGGRAEIQRTIGGAKWHGKVTFGSEYQYFSSPLKVYDNVNGEPGTNIQSDDQLGSNQLLGFAQMEVDLPGDFMATVGASANFLRYNFSDRLADPDVEQQRNFDPEFSPRIAILKKFSDAISAYASYSKGFSPPSLAEVRPSAGTYNDALNPEYGASWEGGVRGGLLNRKLSYDLTAYDFALKETIVIQRADDGAEYFVNAGKTSQRGLEASLSYSPQELPRAITDLRVWATYTYNHYRFVDYVQDGNDYSDNRLTGVAPTIFWLGTDITIWKFYVNLSGGFTDAIPLDDANSEYAESYVLVSTRLGFKGSIAGKVPIEIFTGVDNLLDERYSLGNDLNAFGGRYYNAAAPRNYFAGISIMPYQKR
jgi:iron complex outermembrane receptor protein